GQVDDGIQQLSIFTPARAGDGAGCCIQGFANALLTLPAVSKDGSPGNCGCVLAGVGNDKFYGTEDAMPARIPARLDSCKLEGHYFAVEQSDNPTHGPHKALRFSRAPVHVLGPVDGGDFLWKILSQNFSSGPPFLGDGSGQVFAFGIRDLFQFGYVDSCFL